MTERCVHDDIVTDLALKEHKGVDLASLGFKEYVSMGRELINKVECYQARIAFYALKVCTIRHGGRSDEFYTLKDYAQALNITAKTLQGWTLTYRNVILKLGIPLKEIDSKTWKTANRTNDGIAWNNRRDNKEKGTNRKATKYKKDIPAEEVRKMFDEENNDEPSVAAEFRDWTRMLRNISNKLDKRDLNLIHHGDLLELMRLLDASSDKINDFLTKNKKRS